MAWVRRWLALSTRGWVLFGLAIVNVVLIWLFGQSEMSYAPPDVITLEFCFWPSVFRSVVVDQWGSEKAGFFVATLSRLDFLFPLAYASFLRGLYVWLSARLTATTWRVLEAVPWVAAGFDVVENLLLIHLIGQALGGATTGFGLGVLTMSLCAAVKAALITASVLGTLAVVLRSDVGWATWTCRFGLLSVLMGSLPLILTSQGQDLLRVVADEALSKLQTLVMYMALLLWATSVWYWSRVLLQIRWPQAEPEDVEATPAAREIASWLPRVLGTATLLLAGLAFLKAAPGVPALRGKLHLHAGYCLALGALFFYAVKYRRRIFGLPSEPKREGTWRKLPRTTRAIAAASLAASAVTFVIFVMAPVFVGWSLGTPAIVFLAAANAVFFGSGTVLVGRTWRVPVVAFALLAAAVFSVWNDNHAVRLLPLDKAPRPGLREAFEGWAGPRIESWKKEKPGPMPVFLVAAEGGGIRAAYWTAVVLGRMEDRHPGFARHVFGISGVSGGSLGAAAFVALLHDGVPESACRTFAKQQGRSQDGTHEGPLETCAREVLRQDLLAPAVGTLVAPDFMQWFVPVPVPVLDRGRTIEDSWSAAYRRVTGKDTLDQAFLSVSRGQSQDGGGLEELRHPALLLNGTHVHTGQRLLRAPFTWPKILRDDPSENRMPEITDLTELLVADVRLATAAHDSARFAYVSPAGRLLSAEGRDFGHVVDGGYFENSGAATLRDVLDALEGATVAEEVEFRVVYLCNNAGRCYGSTVSPDPARAQPREPGLGEVFSPVRALLGAREARGSLAIAHLKQRLGRRFLELGVCAVKGEAPVPLGWQLSELMRRQLSQQAAGGAKGVVASEGCVTEALAGGGATCRPPFNPDDGCNH